MSSKYINGKTIIKNRKIKGFELLDFVINGLTPHTKTGKIFNCPRRYNLKIQLNGINKWITKLEHPDFPKNLSFWEKERLSFYDTPEMFLHELEHAQIKYTQKMKLLENKTGDRSWSWFYIDLPYLEKEAEKLINDLVDSYYLKDDVSKFLPSKLRPSQRHRLTCRDVAGKLWEKDPTITIVSMAKRPEIKEACEGEKYAESTIRNWIKDLNPNREPGRRKGT